MTFEYKTQPMGHQRIALNKLAKGKPQRDGAGALFMEQGTGKTFVYLVDAAWRYEQGEIDTLIIISKNGVQSQIIDQEVPKHIPDRIRHEAHWYKPGTVNAALWKSLQRTDRLVILAFNIEMLGQKATFKNLMRCLFVEKDMGGKGPKPTTMRRVMVVVDESHLIRTPAAKRTRNAWTLGDRAKVRRIGTGTEIAKGFENLYAQFRFLDWRIIGEKTYTAFKTKYCREVGDQIPGQEHSFSRIVGYKNIDELMARIEPYVFVCEKKDCMDLPPQHFLDDPPRVVPLTPEQKRLIRELRDNYVTQLESGELIEAGLAISRLQKIQQITGGHVGLPDGTWKPIPNGSLDAAVDIASNVRGQFIVWAQWQADIVQLAEAMASAGVPCVTYYGGNSDRVNEANKAAFKDGRARGFLATYGKGSTGLDFPGVDTTIYYTLTFDSIDYWQSISRNHRMGTDRPVTYYYLHRPGSTDAKLLKALKDKEDIAELMRDPDVFKRWMDSLLDEDPRHDEILHHSAAVCQHSGVEGLFSAGGFTIDG